MLKMVSASRDTSDTLIDIAKKDMVAELEVAAEFIKKAGSGVAKIGERFKPMKNMGWVTLDYNIEESQGSRGTAHYGVIYDTMTGTTVWTGSPRRRKRDAERFTRKVLEVLEEKFTP